MITIIIHMQTIFPPLQMSIHFDEILLAHAKWTGILLPTINIHKCSYHISYCAISEWCLLEEAEESVTLHRTLQNNNT